MRTLVLKNGRYQGLLNDSRLLCVLPDVMEMNKGLFPDEELYNPQEWLSSIDGENCWIEPASAMLEQAWHTLQAVPVYTARYQCYHAGLAGFFQAIAMLASEEVDPLTLDWEEANEWRELQDKWELIGEPS